MAGKKKTTPYMRAGEKYARWTLLEDGFYSNEKVLCRCECGAEKGVYASTLRKGLSQSCGCLRAELHQVQIRTHGLAEHELYNTWLAITHRCTRPSHRDWANYGGRGITVCERWLGPDGLVSFIADMGPRPTPKHSVDRIDNNKGYEPGNCQWATQKQQMSNTRAKVQNKQYDAAVAERDRLRQLVCDLGGDPDAQFHQVALWPAIAA